MIVSIGIMSSPMFLTLPTDVPAEVYGAISIRERLEPKSIQMSRSLQEMALREGWTGASSPGRGKSTPRSLPTMLTVQPGLVASPRKATDGEPAHAQNASLTQCKQDELGVDGIVRAFQSRSMPALEFKPANKELGLEVARLSLKHAEKSSRWWTTPRFPAICPFSGFPINLLPYPPFKLRQCSSNPNPNSLVDGKFFALLMISIGSINVNGRYLELSEVDALGKHIQRCKLGPHRPDIALSLAKKACDATLPENERAEAVQALGKMRSAARSELGKLKCIQEQRLFQLHDQLTSSDAGLTKKFHPQESVFVSTNSEPRKTTKQALSKPRCQSSSASTCTISSGNSSSESEDNWEALAASSSIPNH